MKEIKAYIRTSVLEKVVETLKEKGAPGITIVTVHPVGYGFESRFSFSEVEVTKKYFEITKIELVCDNKDLDTFVNAIVACSHTGASGDGLILISEVDEIIKIRTQKRGVAFTEVDC